MVKDCDPVTGEPESDEGYDDDYQLEDIDVAVSDYVMRAMKVKHIVLDLNDCHLYQNVKRGIFCLYFYILTA